ncbi:MAG: tRNA 2'-O-methylase [candidate division BRC1 bacterium ADurb.BinA364]|nr:MAG: tRNA 2'-O-methylase [candidate division BRC1 bacterium ADurb.BinA364]
MTHPSRSEAMALLLEYNRSEALINHAKAVEAAMRHFARRRGEDEELWGVVGLIHDLDYERFPAEHCRKSREILEQRGWPSEIVRAVVSHGFGICSNVEPQNEMEKTLFAIDELTGLIAACALVRPSKSVADLEPKSVMKKWNQKAFAAGANREIIDQGCAMLGIERAELIAETIAGMRQAAREIGL